jgi:hypothetical protein
MGLLQRIAEMADHFKSDQQRTQEYEQFMDGYRQGFPLVGEQLPPAPEKPSREYRRGLAAGKQDYIPGIPCE